MYVNAEASRSQRREVTSPGASGHWCRGLVVGAVFRVALFRLSATSPLVSALRRCAGRRLRGAEAAGRVPEAGGVWASCLLAPAGAGRAWVSEFLGGCCFGAAGGTTTGTGTPQRREITFRRGARSSWFRATRVRGLWSLASVTPERRRVTPG